MINFNVSVSVKDGKRGANTSAFEKDIDGNATFLDFVESFKEFLQNTALDALEQEQSRGFDKKPRIRVDNVFDSKSIANVKPFGKIEFFAKVVVTESLVKIYEELFRRSPVDTGKYKSHHVVFFNKQYAASSVEELKTFLNTTEAKGGFKLGDTIRFLNITPYARRLEFKGSRRGLGKVSVNQLNPRTRKNKEGKVLKRPNGTYYLVYRLARSKYASIARFIRFSFLPNGKDGIYVQKLPGERNTFAEDDRTPYLYPSIVIRLSDKGIEPGVVYE